MPVEPRQAADIIGAILRSAGAAPIGDPGEVNATPTADKFGYVPPESRTIQVQSTGIGNPLEHTDVSSPYGPRGSGFHGGVDLNAASGTTLLAANSGRVTHAANDDPGGYGTWIEITGDDGVVTRYGHLAGMNVSLGDVVQAGAVIGQTGGARGAAGAGNSEGPHLHFEVRVNGQTTDPMSYLAQNGQILSKASAGEDLGEIVMEPGSPTDVASAQLQNVEDVIRGNPASQDPLKPTIKPGEAEPGDTKGTVSIEGGGDAESWIRTAMMLTGVDESWYAGLHRRMMQESGGQNIPQGIVDINTEKGTPAFGPMQVIEPTFNAYKLPGYEDWHNPLHNTIAAIRYIQSRYGHPDNLPSGGY